MDSDFLLIMKMKRGEDDAFEKFVRKYYGEILKYCTFRCFNTEYAEDLTQETFLRFFSNLPDYRYKGKTKNFLYTIAGNLCKNFYKKKKDIPTEQEELEKQSSPITDSLDSVLDKVVVESAIKRLSKEYQEVIILYYFQDLKISQIADILNISVPLVKYRLKQAKKHMQQFMGEEEHYEYRKNNKEL